MATITDFAFVSTSGVLSTAVGQWVRLHSIALATDYFSTAATDGAGSWTVANVPPDDYQLYTGPAATVPGTPTLVNPHYRVSYSAGDNLAVQSITSKASGPFTPNLPGASSIPTPAGVLAGKFWDYGGSTWNIRAFNGKGDGVTDDTVAIQAAQTAAALGGVIDFPQGTFPFSTTLVPVAAQTFQGKLNATVLKWVGAASGFMFAISPAAGSAMIGFSIRDMVIDANNSSSTVPMLMNSWQVSLLENVVIQNVATAGTAALRMEVTAGTGSANNNYGNVIINLRIRNAPTGIQLAGQLGGSTNNFVTNNRFFGVYMESISGVGIRGVQWCDSNAFFGVEISLSANNAIGVLLNDSATPAVDTGVYNFNMHHISVDSFGLTGCSGIFLNAAKQSIFYDFYHSPVVFGGTAFNDNAGRAISYDVVLTQDNNSTNNIVHMSKNVIYDNAAGAGLGAYANWIAWSSATTGNAPTIAPVGNDPNPNLQISAKGSGFLYMNGPLRAAKDFRRSTQTPTEAVLVSGVDASAGELILPAALTAARLVGAPLNAVTGQELTFTLVQDGTGGRVVTWNAIFKVSWSDAGNTLNKRSTVTFWYDGTNWNQKGAQVPYV